MTIKEMFESKYQKTFAELNERDCKRLEKEAERKNISFHQALMLHLIISENECENCEMYLELVKMNEEKLVASNRHRSYYGKVDCFWLTKKGYKKLFL